MKNIQYIAYLLFIGCTIAQAEDRRVRFISKNDQVKLFIVDDKNQQKQIEVRERPQYEKNPDFVAEADLVSGANGNYIKQLVIQTYVPQPNTEKIKAITTNLSDKQVGELNTFLKESSAPGKGRGIRVFLILKDAGGYHLVPAPGFD